MLERFLNLFKRIFGIDETEYEDYEGGEFDENGSLNYDPKEAGHVVLEHCEQIIEATRNAEDCKREFKAVTGRLIDIDTLSKIPRENFTDAKKAADQTVVLMQSRNDYLNAEKKITDAQFNMIEQSEDEIPDAIRSLLSNESYQDTLQRDMSYLEGEKLQWIMFRNELLNEKKKLKTASFILMGIFIAVLVFIAALDVVVGISLMHVWITLAFATVIGGFYIVIRRQSIAAELRQSKLNANRAISLLNKTKVKYVSITNAVDYSRDKYHVESGKELEHQWENYMDAVRDRERYLRATDDLEYFSGRLGRELKKYDLLDTKFWVDHPKALVDKNEMNEIQHELMDLRHKIRARVQYYEDVKKNEREQIDRLMVIHPEYEQEIKKIISTVDKLSRE
ncbi:MAG: hypothetical protein K6E56_00120 [Lachnospiraceae bacterium]|nr:hypothetical protein [Lachnospiraceae bacterium]